MSILNLTLCLLSFLALFLNIAAHVKKVDNGDVFAAIHTHSGNIWLGRNESVSPTRDPRNVALSFEEFSEKDEDGNMVGLQEGHTISNLYAERYAFENFTNVPRTYNDVEAVGYDYTHNLTQVNGNVAATFYLFTQHGNIPMGGDDAHVFPGNALFALTIKNWAWTANGKYLDVVYSVMGPSSRMPAIKTSEFRTRSRKELDLGEGAELIAPMKVKVDGTWKEFSQDFPAFETGGRLRLRIPRFLTSAEYHILLQPVASSEPDLVYAELTAPSTHRACLFDHAYQEMLKRHDPVM